jgi:hypothetical protein
MGMAQPEESGVTVSAGNKTCCVASQAPAPEAQTWAGSFAVAAPPALTSGVLVPAQSAESKWSSEVEQDSSPPPLQSLLCTFLI